MEVFFLRKYDTVYIFTEHNEQLKKYTDCTTFDYKHINEYTNILTSYGFRCVYGTVISKL